MPFSGVMILLKSLCTLGGGGDGVEGVNSAFIFAAAATVVAALFTKSFFFFRNVSCVLAGFIRRLNESLGGRTGDIVLAFGFQLSAFNIFHLSRSIVFTHTLPRIFILITFFPSRFSPSLLFHDMVAADAESW